MPTSPPRYVVASCHVEAPLDDRVWEAFSRLQAARPGGIPVAALIRLPHDAAGEDRALWLERARAAAARGAFGLHIHWLGPKQATPVGIDAAPPLLREAEWVRSEGLRPTLFCGGRWHMDRGVADVCARLGYADCTARRSRPTYFTDERWAQLAEPTTVVLADGLSYVALPSTHSPREAIRAAFTGNLPAWTHLAFHDTDLLVARRRAAVIAALRLLGRLRRPGDLAALAAQPPVVRVRWDEIERGGAAHAAVA